MNLSEIKKKIIKNKYKIIAFLIGYILMIVDFKLLKELSIIFNNVDLFYGIIFNLLYILLSYISIKVIIKVYKNTLIIESDGNFEKLFSYFKIISIGAYIGFLCIIGQAFVIGLISQHGTIV